MPYSLPVIGKLHFIFNSADPLAKTLANEMGKDGFSSDLVNGEGLIQNQSKIFLYIWSGQSIFTSSVYV